MSVLDRVSFEEVSAAAHLIWMDRAVADRVAVDAWDVISRTARRKPIFFNGKITRCFVGGLFYLMGYRYDVARKQRELADRLGTSDVSIRVNYRQWLEEFPDLFLDVIGKFAQDSTLRYYVLLNWKQRIAEP
jgi:hypothetical protein